MTNYTNPHMIARDSFAQIKDELQQADYHFEGALADVIERVIHSTADFDFADSMQFSPTAINAGVSALQQGCALVCDVNMIRVGISQRRVAALGGSLHCFVAEEETRQQAQNAATTRSAMGLRLAAQQGLLQQGIAVIGNAPTALYEVIQLLEQGVQPALIIGVPVGFVSTVESKAALTQVSRVPWITSVGRKGGSPVAVAIVNALLRLAVNVPSTAVD